MKSELNSLFAIGIAAAFTFACGSPAPEVVEEDEDAISASTPAFVSLRHDDRRCISPLCGGYWLKDLNRNRAEVYVSGLDFSQSGFDEATITLIQETSLDELVLQGVLGPREQQYRTRALMVQGAWRGLPGVVRSASDKFYSVTSNDPPIQCFAAPCNNDVATLLNRTTTRGFTGVDVGGVVRNFVDPAFVTSQVERYGALVAGHFEDGVRHAAGPETLLVASQVYLSLPSQRVPCPLFPIAQCPEGLVNVFTRNADRCTIPAGCAEQLFCPQFIPSCDEGYTMESWTGGSGCPAFACDPTFLSPPPPPSRCQHVRCAAGFHCVDEGDEVCVPNLTCALVLCAVGNRCVEPDGGDAYCAPEVWVSEVVSAASANPYRNNERQEWIFTSDVPDTNAVRLHFSRFDLESGWDFVTIYDPAGNELARYTGVLGEFTTDAFAGAEVRIVFTTDRSVTRSGFEIDRADARTP
jgi:hypothetical protein